MTLTKFTIFVAAAAFLTLTVLSKEGDHKIHLKGIQCNTSDKIVLDNVSCFAKSYSRTFSGMNIAVFMKKPIYDVQVCFFTFTRC